MHDYCYHYYCYWHCRREYLAGSMHRPGVCLSVPAWFTAANFAAAAQPAGDIDRLLHGAQQCSVQRANAGSATLSAYAVAEQRLVMGVIIKNNGSDLTCQKLKTARKHQSQIIKTPSKWPLLQDNMMLMWRKIKFRDSRGIYWIISTRHQCTT